MQCLKRVMTKLSILLKLNNYKELHQFSDVIKAKLINWNYPHINSVAPVED